MRPGPPTLAPALALRLRLGDSAVTRRRRSRSGRRLGRGRRSRDEHLLGLLLRLGDGPGRPAQDDVLLGSRPALELVAPFHQDGEERRRDEERRDRAQADADEESEGEVLQRRPAEEQQSEMFAIVANFARGISGMFSRTRSKTMIVS
jgi:hypothetical protein